MHSPLCHRRTFQNVKAHRPFGGRCARFQRSGGPGGSRTHLGGFADRHLTSRTLDLEAQTPFVGPLCALTLGARGRIRTDTRLVLSEPGMPNSRHSRIKSKRPAVSSGPRELLKSIWVLRTHIISSKQGSATQQVIAAEARTQAGG